MSGRSARSRIEIGRILTYALTGTGWKDSVLLLFVVFAIGIFTTILLEDLVIAYADWALSTLGLPKLLSKAILCLLLLVIAAIAMVRNWRRNSGPSTSMMVAPEPKSMLVLNIGPYKAFGGKDAPFPVLADLAKAATDFAALGDIRSAVANTSWAPNFDAIALHASALKEVVAMHDRDNEAAYTVFRSIVEKTLGRRVSVTHEELNDVSNVPEMVDKYWQTFRHGVEKYGPGQVVFDFTGGTSAMSSAMNLAGIDQAVWPQYVRPGKLRTSKAEGPQAPLDPSEPAKTEAIVFLKTSHALIHRPFKPGE